MFSPMWIVEFRYVCLICNARRTQGSIKGQLVWRGKKNGRKGGLSVIVSSFACLFEGKKSGSRFFDIDESKMPPRIF